MLKGQKEIVALDMTSYLSMLALKIEIGFKYCGELAQIKKGWAE